MMTEDAGDSVAEEGVRVAADDGVAEGEVGWLKGRESRIPHSPCAQRTWTVKNVVMVFPRRLTDAGGGGG